MYCTSIILTKAETSLSDLHELQLTSNIIKDTVWSRKGLRKGLHRGDTMTFRAGLHQP